MKRYIYIIATFALATAVSCNKEGRSQGGNEGELNPIEFSAEIQTKTNLVENVDSLKHQAMSLYGWFYYPNTEGPVFAMNNLPLEWTGIGWDYSPRQYWMQTAYGYGFAGIWPYLPSRSEITPSENPNNDIYHADDVARNIIARVKPLNAYLTKSMEDVMIGYKGVETDQFGRAVTLPMEHAMSAFRVRVRNLADQNMVIANWYLVNLACHADVLTGIIGKNAEGNVTQPMTRIPDANFAGLKHAPVDIRGVRDSIMLQGNFAAPDGTAFENNVWYECVDPAATVNNYRFMVLSQRLRETCDHEPSAGDLDDVKAIYANDFPNYSRNIYWGNTKGLPDNHYYMPVAYVKGASIYDFDNNGIRGNQGDFNKGVHVFECRSHFYNASTGNNLATSESLQQGRVNGGIFLPVSESNEALLYSPYFFSAGSHTGTPGDWVEGSVIDRESIFYWVDDNGNPTPPSKVETCLANYTARNKQFTASVAAGDLKNSLNEDGYVLVFPQDLQNLEFHIWSGLTGETNPTENTTYEDISEKYIRLVNYTKDRVWKPGYKYDYLLTITSKKILVSLDIEPWHNREYTLE